MRVVTVHGNTKKSRIARALCPAIRLAVVIDYLRLRRLLLRFFFLLLSVAVGGALDASDASDEVFLAGLLLGKLLPW